MVPQLATHDDDKDQTCDVYGCDEDGEYRVVDDNVPDPDVPHEEGMEFVTEDLKGDVYEWKGPTITVERWFCEDHNVAGLDER